MIKLRMKISEVEHIMIVPLTQIALLSNKLHNLLDESVDGLSKSIEMISNHPIMQKEDLAKIAEREGYRTFAEYDELEKRDPERVKLINEQMGLKFFQNELNREMDLTEQVFPNLTTSSLVIMAYSLFERGLYLYCDSLSNSQNYKIHINDLNGNSIVEKGQRYLTKVVDVGYDYSTSDVWRRIKGHQSIRNLLTHNGGLLDSSDKSNKAKIFIDSNISGLSVRNSSLIIGREYIVQVVKDYQLWYEEIFTLIKQKNIT